MLLYKQPKVFVKEKAMTDKQKNTLMTALRQSGLFVTSGLNPPNVMSTHWGLLGMLWNKNVFVLPVRKSKMSNDLIKSNGSFAVSVPIKDMRNEIIMCDHMSGFFTNKFEELHLHPQKAKSIPAYVLAECGLILECKVALAADMTRENTELSLLQEMYSCKDFHTLFFGEIVECYENGK